MEEEHFIPFGKLQKILVFICGGGWGVSNAVQVGLGVLLSQIHREWGVSYLQQSLVSVFTMVGMFVGSFFWGFVADRYGRRKAFSKVLIFVALGIAVAVFSPNVWMLASCYIIVGFGLGGSYAVDGNVFLEYCPPNKQYILTSLSSLSSLGSCLPPALSLIYLSLNTPYEWQLLQGSIGLIALIISIPRFWIQETPAFLLSKHRTTLVLNLVETMRKVEDRDSLVEKVLLATPKEITEERSIKEQIRCLFKKPLRNLTIFYSVIWGCSSFTFSGISSFMPVVLTRAGFDGSSVYETMLFQQFAGFPGILISTYLVSTRLGRKKALYLSQLFGTCLIFSFLLKDRVAVTVLSVFYFFFENSFLAIQYCITPETFPSEVRNTAIGLFTGATTIGSMLSPFAAALILETTSSNLGFILLMSSALLITFLCSLFIIETRNFDPKSLGELNYNKS